MEDLLGVSLADDLGESISDGVLLCKLVNMLHPNTIATIHIPRDGEVNTERLHTTSHIS